MVSNARTSKVPDARNVSGRLYTCWFLRGIINFLIAVDLRRRPRYTRAAENSTYALFPPNRYDISLVTIPVYDHFPPPTTAFETVSVFELFITRPFTDNVPRIEIGLETPIPFSYRVYRVFRI